LAARILRTLPKRNFQYRHSCDSLAITYVVIDAESRVEARYYHRSTIGAALAYLFWRARSDTRYSKLFTRNGDDHRIARQLFVAGLLLAGAGILLGIFCLVALLAMLLT
jgi:hypothetical protein